MNLAITNLRPLSLRYFRHLRTIEYQPAQWLKSALAEAVFNALNSIVVLTDCKILTGEISHSLLAIISSCDKCIHPW